MKTKIMCLLLAVLMLSTGLLIACGSEEAKPTGDAGGVAIGGGDPTDPAEIYDAEVKNLNGHEFRFVSRDWSMQHWATKEIYAEAPNGDKINDAVFQRNAQLQQVYNCTIAEDKYVDSDVAAMLRDPLMAGEYVADYVYTRATESINLASANLLADMGELDNIDLTKAWWDQSIVSNMNVGGKVFFLSGSAGISDDYCAWATCYNKDYVKEYKSDLDLYQIAREGKWTVDLLYEIMSNTWKDNDGDGVLKYDVDRYGWVGAYQDNYFMLLAGNITAATYSANGDIHIPEQPKAEVMDAWAKLRPLLTSQYRCVGDAPVYVRTGLATFATQAAAASVLKSGQSEVNMGLLPIPKLYESQDKYYCGVYYGMCCVYSIPNTVENAVDWESNGFTSGVEQAAYFLEAFAYYSHMILKPAFYEQVMLKQNATDDQSAEMVELCFENKVYDPVAGYRWGGLVDAFYSCGSGANWEPATDINYDNLVSTYTARVKSCRKAIDNYIKAINTETVI